MYDVAVSRAVANLAVLAEYCMPFVKIGGHFIALKSKTYKEELDQAQKAIEILGGKVKDVVLVSLPEVDIDHTLVIIEKKYLRHLSNIHEKLVSQLKKIR